MMSALRAACIHGLQGPSLLVNGEVVNLFRILQRHYPQFMDTLKFQITSRREFERLKACDPATLTDLERAARFIYLQKLAFGAKVTGQTFGVNIEGSAPFNLTRLAPVLEDVHERLAGVVMKTSTGWIALIGTTGRERCSTSTRRISAAKGTTARRCSAATSSPPWPSAGRGYKALRPLYQ